MNALQILTSHLALPSIIAVLYIGQMLRIFSKRMGEVTKMKPYYRWFNLGNAFVTLSILGYTLYNNAMLGGGPPFFTRPFAALLLFHLPLALGVIINLSVTLVYWGWLLGKS
ncbi:MAG: hypothetical protein ACP5HM_02150 [Anaerolineae bacterium]